MSEVKPESEPKPEVKEEAKEEVKQDLKDLKEGEEAKADEAEAENPASAPKKRVSFNDSTLTASEPEKLSNPVSGEAGKTQSILKNTGSSESSPPPPPKPKRPLSPRERAKKQLKEAFPKAEDKIINAILIASEGDLDPAFNALLYLSDPESKVEIPEPKPKPAVPPKHSRRTLQMMNDEKLARKLAREYQDPVSRAARGGAGPAGKPLRKSSRRVDSDEDDEDNDDPLNQFLDEDLPQIKKQLEKGFEETKQKVGSFFSDLTKQFQMDDAFNPAPRDRYSEAQRRERSARDINSSRVSQESQNEKNGKLFGALGSLGSPPGSARTSATFKRDSEEISEKFNTISMQDHSKDLPDVPIVTSKAKPEETDLYGTPKKVDNVSKTGKWEPLTEVAPQPVNDDAFLVTSSDEEDDDKK